MQGFTFAHGFDTPPEIDAAGLNRRYKDVMKNVIDAAGQITSVMSKASGNGVADSSEAEYLIPLAYRKRTLFKMDFAEALYIAELRTTPAGHVSYRKVAYAMFEQVAGKYPALAKYFRVKDVQEPVDLLKR